MSQLDLLADNRKRSRQAPRMLKLYGFGRVNEARADSPAYRGRVEAA